MDIQQTLLFVNFFYLSIALLSVYYYAYRLRFVLKRTEDLRKEAEKFRTLFNTTSDGVFQTDTEGNFLLINKAGANMIGYDGPDKLLQERPCSKEFFVDEDVFDRMFGEIKSKGVVQNFTAQVKHKDETHLFIEITAHSRKNQQGELLGFEGIFRDTTRRIELEEELRSYSENLEEKVQKKTEEVLKLERQRIQLEKMAEVGEIASSIVHEVRNPLSSIKMGLTSLIRRLKLEPKDQTCLELAAKEVGHLEKILRDLRDFSKPQEMRFLPQDVNHILNSVLTQIADDFKELNIQIAKQFKSDLPEVLVDSNCMHQVFLNIIINAKQAMAEGGSLSIRTRPFNHRSMVRIEIDDTGSGIEEEMIEKIFNPFFSTKREGTGLGLLIVKKIIEAHRGTIGVTSHPGSGTRVLIELPTE